MSLIRETGEALYGPRWQSDLARDLKVSIRTMQRWAAAPEEVPPRIRAELLDLVQRRAAALGAVADLLTMEHATL